MIGPARAPLVVVLAVVCGLGAAVSFAGTAASTHYEVIVQLTAPPLAEAPGSATAIAVEQRRLVRALARQIPEAAVGWRYRRVLNGISVVLPRRIPAHRLRGLPGVRAVFSSTTYSSERSSLDSTPDQIDAPALWPTGIADGGAGVKIGIIDDGIDQTHRFFSPSGFTMPVGFPKGQRSYTSAKVIVARSFPPPGTTRPGALKPFEQGLSDHGTHVAGIAAGDAGTVPGPGRKPLSGVAPKAYLGNYRVLTKPTAANVGLDGNAPEIVAAIEAAVRDGMDVINLSIGEPEIEPGSDVVALALDAAAAAGVVPVVAGGNDYLDFGKGSISSPGTSQQAITVGAVTSSRSGRPHVVADFSSVGPTPISLRLKPDVSAPGTAVLSSVPGNRFEPMSGTSMASPHVAGAAALLRRRHPEWTVAEIKSALVSTAAPARGDRTHEALPSQAGGGVVSIGQADRPLLFTSPTSISFGLVHVGAVSSASVSVADANGGRGEWNVSVETLAAPTGANVSAPATAVVPGELTLTVQSPESGATGELTGFLVLTRGADRRRVPFWSYLERPELGNQPVAPLMRSGLYGSTTTGRQDAVSIYRYPELPAGLSPGGPMKGPERLYRIHVDGSVANFGVAILSRSEGVEVEPRIVRGTDENALVGYAALPIALNPYLSTFGAGVLAAGAIRPSAGDYTIVFDSPTAAGAGAFTFRYWVDDVSPPTLTLATRQVERGHTILLRVADAGSGVDPASAAARIDGVLVGGVTVEDRMMKVPTRNLRAGRHVIRAQVSDFQESRNMENVGPILPNTRVVRATVLVT